jgi:hypothetical protein
MAVYAPIFGKDSNNILKIYKPLLKNSLYIHLLNKSGVIEVYREYRSRNS